MMKCGSCRATDAASYNKIAADDDLFKILKHLDPNRVYNPKYSYFCGACIELAKIQLSHKLTTFSDQNAHTFSRLNVSSSSGSSKDEYDLLVAPPKLLSDNGTPLVIPPNQNKNKRPAGSMANPKSKPCPKRFKMPLGPIQLRSIPEVPQREISQDTSQPNIAEVTPEQDLSSQQKSSQSISENELLYDVDDNASSQTSNGSSASDEERSIATSLQPNISPRNSNSLSSKGLSNRPEVASGSKSDTVATNPKTLPRQKDNSGRDALNSSNRQGDKATRRHRPDSHQHEVIPSGVVDNASSQTSNDSSASAEERSITTSLQPNISPRSSDSLSSKDLPNRPEVASGSKSDTVATNPKTLPRQKDDSDGDVSSSSNRQGDRATRQHRPEQHEVILSGVDDNASSQTSNGSSASLQPNISPRSSNSLSSKGLPNRPEVAKGSKTDTVASNPKTLVRGKRNSDGDVSNSSNQHRDETIQPQRPDSQSNVQGTIGGPSAPPVKNPRIREENRNMPRDVREYFATSNFQVGNYSRSLAG